MKKAPIFYLAMCIFLLSGCASLEGGSLIEKDIPSAKKGYLVKSISAKAGSFETPPYLPEKLAFELKQILRAEGLLAEDRSDVKGVMVFLEIEAGYAGGVSGTQRYRDLQTRLLIRDGLDPCYAARAVFKSFNGFGAVLSDFVEREQARDMAEFLKQALK
jgi:hypothetical protein